MNVNEFGKIFYKLRMESGLTQEDMARNLGVSKSTIGMWETNRRLPSPELYEQIADYFNVDIDYLYGRSSVRQRIHYDNDGTAYVPISSSDNQLSDEERNLLANYNRLNTTGKGKAREYISDLLDNDKYTKDTELLNA